MPTPQKCWRLSGRSKSAQRNRNIVSSVVASMRVEGSHEDLRIGIASDEVVGTYSVTADDLLRQAPENVPHCIGMLRHDDRLALVLDLSRLLEVYPGPSI